MKDIQASDKLSNLQLELLKIFNFEVSDQQLKDIRSLLSNYFADLVTRDMDALFEKNNWNEKKIEEWSKEHMRINDSSQ
jgi:hypothetical protein